MRYCTNCGRAVQENAQHCPHCGKALPERKLSPIPFYLIGFTLLVASGVLLGNHLRDQPPLPSPTVATIEATAKPSAPMQPTPGNRPTQKPPTQTAIPPTNTMVEDLPTTFAFDWSKCHAAYSTRLEIGDAVVIGNFSSPFGYNVLNGPYKERGIAGEISPGDRAKIINGPSCSNRWIWWIIKLDKNDVSGWIPEGDANSFWLLSADDLSGGRTAIISREVGEVNLRRSPGYVNKNDQNDVIVKLPTGTTVKLLEGPQETDGLNWWFVEWNGYQGWIAERTSSGRTIMTFNP